MNIVHRRLLTMSLLLAALFLVTVVVSCSRASESTPMPTPVAAETRAAVGLRSGGDAVVASGEVVPAQEAQLGFGVLGRVQTVAVTEGDGVQAGQVLVTLETGLLEADVTQAEAGVAAAQARLALLKAGPRPGDVAAAQAQLEAAQAALAQAAAQRDQLIAGATQAEVAAARAQLAAAQAEEKSARIAYDQLRDRKVEDWEEQVTILRLRAAEQDRAAAEAQLAQAEEGAEVQVRAARAGVWAAAAQRDVAQARRDMLQAGVAGEEVAAAEAAVAQAEAALDAARAALDQATLRAPSIQKGSEAAPSIQKGSEAAPSIQKGSEAAPSIQKGSEAAPFASAVTALEVSPGETVMPGQTVLTLADLHRLQVETTDLGERDVNQVAVGQPATVYVEALGVEIGGQVVDIAPQANTIGGDVVYAVTIELDEQPPGLRWGMSVEVEIATG